MHIFLGADAGTELNEPDNFQGFSVEVPAEVSAETLAALVHRSGLGELDADGGHFHVNIDSVRRLATGRGGSDWDAGFDAMIAYARTKGWVDNARNTVRAHIEPK